MTYQNKDFDYGSLMDLLQQEKSDVKTFALLLALNR